MLLIVFIIEMLKVLNIPITLILTLGAVIVYDSTDPDTFKKMSPWVKELQ